MLTCKMTNERFLVILVFAIQAFSLTLVMANELFSTLLVANEGFAVIL